VAPVYTGDSFAFTVPSALPSIQPLTPAFTGSSQCSGGHDICDFDISWSETAGQLTAVQITFDSFDDSIDLGLTRGQTASDNVLGGCVTSQCAVAGFWQSNLLLSEPGSAALLASGLFGAWLGRRRRTGRVSVANL
jgi:MYXO-CTERM domain-containing protein